MTGGVPRRVGWPALAVIGAFLIWGVAVPVASLVWTAARQGVPLLDPATLAIARLTFAQALLSSSLAALLGLPLGLLTGRILSAGSAHRRWARTLETLLAIPFGVPAIVAADAWVIWLGRSGWLARWGLELDWSYSLRAVVLAHVAYNVPWVALLVAHARRELPARQLEAAATLGAGAWGRFRSVIFPQVRFNWLCAWAQAQALCAMSFVLVLILGGGPPVETLETALYSRVRYGTLDLGGAIACALWELVIAGGPWLLALALERRSAAAPPAGRAAPVSPVALAAALSLAALFVVPYLAVLDPSVLATWFAPGFAPRLRAPLALSAALALSTAAVTVGLAVCAVLATSFLSPRFPRAGKLLVFATGIPGGISVLALGLGLWLAYGRRIDPLTGSVPAMIALQAALFLPLAMRMLWPVSRGTRTRGLEAALSLGASPWAAFRWVEWPRWRPVLAATAALTAAASLGEVAAVSLFYSEKLVPLPLLLSRWMAQYRFDDARALSALLFCLCAGTIAAVLVASSYGGGERVPIS